MTCQTCKWWDDQPSYFLTRPCHHPHIVELAEGKDCPADGLEFGYAGDEDSEEDDHGASISFGPDFQCIHYEPTKGERDDTAD